MELCKKSQALVGPRHKLLVPDAQLCGRAHFEDQGAVLGHAGQCVAYTPHTLSCRANMCRDTYCMVFNLIFYRGLGLLKFKFKFSSPNK